NDRGRLRPAAGRRRVRPARSREQLPRRGRALCGRSAEDHGTGLPHLRRRGRHAPAVVARRALRAGVGLEGRGAPLGVALARRRRTARVAARCDPEGRRRIRGEVVSKKNETSPWLDFVQRVERAIGEPVESWVRSDAYFDLVTQMNRARQRFTKSFEDYAEQWLHMFNVPAACDDYGSNWAGWSAWWNTCRTSSPTMRRLRSTRRRSGRRRGLPRRNDRR